MQRGKNGPAKYELCDYVGWPKMQFIFILDVTYIHIQLSMYTTADLQSCAGLRSASTCKYQILRTRIKFDERSLSYAGPSAWNSLPHHVREITDTMRFRRQPICFKGRSLTHRVKFILTFPVFYSFVKRWSFLVQVFRYELWWTMNYTLQIRLTTLWSKYQSYAEWPT